MAPVGARALAAADGRTDIAWNYVLATKAMLRANPFKLENAVGVVPMDIGFLGKGNGKKDKGKPKAKAGPSFRATAKVMAAARARSTIRRATRRSPKVRAHARTTTPGTTRRRCRVAVIIAACMAAIWSHTICVFAICKDTTVSAAVPDHSFPRLVGLKAIKLKCPAFLFGLAPASTHAVEH